MIGDKKEVYFSQWCKSCKHYNEPETEEPCNECLGEPGNEDSHKPVKWENTKDILDQLMEDDKKKNHLGRTEDFL